jgi:TAT-translocated FGD2 family F420-dependent dehydrogenase
MPDQPHADAAPLLPSDENPALTRRDMIRSTAALLGASAVAGVLPGLPAAASTAAAQTAGPSNRRIGFVLSHEQFDAPHLVTLGRAAEKAGFDIVWASDHFQPWQDNQGHAGQAWITLAALSQHTSRVTFGTGVTCPTFRYEPSVVAQSFASLSRFAPGRVFLGVGTGEALNELASGGGWGMYPERHDRLREAVAIIRQLWSGEWVTFAGDYYKVGPARLYDPPARPIPLYIAASGPQSMRLSGQYGDGLITSPKDLRDPALRAAFAEGARASGRDPQSLPILVESFVVVGDEREARQAAELWRFTPKAWKKAYLHDPDPRSIQRKADTEIPLEDVYREWPVSTDPQVHVQAIAKLFSQGATTVFIHSGQADQMRVIDFYGKQVLPRLRKPIPVPNVVGLPEDSARQRLAAAGLFVSYSDRQGREKLGERYDAFAAGTVVSTLPSPGSPVLIGTGVTLGVREP